MIFAPPSYLLDSSSPENTSSAYKLGTSFADFCPQYNCCLQLGKTILLYKTLKI